MILSVLIPTYNFDCSRLVRDLSRQLPEESEIVVGDDGSTEPESLVGLRAIKDIPQLRLWRAPRNLGRAMIRNRLVEMAQGEWLLFLDSDAQVCSDRFISTYLDNLETDVVCGGTTSLKACPSPEVSLRFRYESRYWKDSAAKVRSQKPYASFTTFNFMVRRKVFETIRFHEALKGYGHEDTLFGKELERNGMTVRHIDNPMVHAGLDRNEEFLRKTEEAMRSLRTMDAIIEDGSRLSVLRSRLERWHLTGLIRGFHWIASPFEEWQLRSSRPSLHVFALYKLGYYISLP